MNVMTSIGVNEGYRVRVMWERPAGAWRWPPLNWVYKPEPIYVFIAYRRAWEKPVRICLRGHDERPVIVDSPLAYDGGGFRHGPHANAARYDAENDGHTLAELFALLHRWARQDRDEWNLDDQARLDRALTQFCSWISHRRDVSAFAAALAA